MIPFEIDVDVLSAIPVGLYLVDVADDFLKVKGVVFVDIIDPKIVDNKGEGDGASFAEIQDRRIFGMEVPYSDNDLFELMVGQFTSLLRPYIAHRISM